MQPPTAPTAGAAPLVNGAAYMPMYVPAAAPDMHVSLYPMD